MHSTGQAFHWASLKSGLAGLEAKKGTPEWGDQSGAALSGRHLPVGMVADSTFLERLVWPV